MATFQSDIAGQPTREPRFGGLIARKATFTFPAGFVQAADDVDLLTIPKGAALVDIVVASSGVGQTVDVGDASDDDRFVSAAANNSVSRMDEQAGAQFAFAEDTVLKLVVNTGNPTADGVVSVAVSYLLTP